MPRISIANGKHFESDSAESLVDAAARFEITIPYSCRTGRCGTCKCKVVSGETSAFQDEVSLSDAEREDGWILSCVRTADTDLVLEVDDLGGVVLPSIKTLPCRVASLQRVASDVIRVLLRLPSSGQFEFRAGQYIDVIGDGGIRRSYSIAAAPSSEKQIELHIRGTPGGVMSKYWFERAKENDLLRLNGPLGTFFLREVQGLDLIFLATGTGIAPVKAMLEGLSASDPAAQPRSISIYWGGRLPDDLYWDPAAAGVECRFVPVLSRAGADWIGQRGHVQDVFMADNPDLKQTVVFACGSEAMINDARSLLTGAGLSRQRFHSDAFVCSAVTK